MRRVGSDDMRDIYKMRNYVEDEWGRGILGVGGRGYISKLLHKAFRRSAPNPFGPHDDTS